MKNKNNPVDFSEKKWWGFTHFEWVMSLLTLFGLVVAFFTGIIFVKQLKEMKTDQRAWISITANDVSFPNEDSLSTVQLSSMLTINNIGKTVARAVNINAVMDYVVNGDSPDFVYASRPRSTESTGVIFPNSPTKMPVAYLQINAKSADKKTEPRYLSPYENKALMEGRGYMVIYAKATYTDVFGTEHWTQFCTFFVHPKSPYVEVTSHKCTDYNETDHEEAGFFTGLF
jgi:hypothetical protein